MLWTPRCCPHATSVVPLLASEETDEITERISVPIMGITLLGQESSCEPNPLVGGGGLPAWGKPGQIWTFPNEVKTRMHHTVRRNNLLCNMLLTIRDSL